VKIRNEELRVRARVTLRLAVCRLSVHLGAKPLEIHNEHFFFQLNTCVHSLYVTSSLMRGWVCHLQMLLALASTVILSSESHGTHDHILLLRFETPSTCRARSLYLCSPGAELPSYNPRHWVPFSSPPTTCRAQELRVKRKSYSQSYFTTCSLPPINLSWRQVPWDPRLEIFFFSNSHYVTSSLMRRWVCLLWICLAFCQVYISLI
jgi:hypothetical protein